MPNYIHNPFYGARRANPLKLARLVEAQGAAVACRHISEAISKRELSPDDFSIRELAEALIPDGREWVHSLGYQKSGRRSLLEASFGVDTSAFSNITGQLVFNRVLEGYENVAFLHPQLCTSQQTQFLEKELVPGVGRLGDVADVVAEAGEYPMIGLSEEYLERGRLQKRGFRIGLTREILIADRTGRLLTQAGKGGLYMGINKEKRVLDVATGQTNNYKRNGTALNTYLSSGAYVNIAATNALVDWSDVENAELLFDAITDPTTSEPIVMPPNLQLLVPSALKHTAKRIVSASEIQHVDNQANASTIRTTSANPIENYSILTSPYVKNRTSSASTWFIGDFKGAITYYYAWDIETTEMGQMSEDAFKRDIMMQWKFGEFGMAQMEEPRRLVKSTA